MDKILKNINVLSSNEKKSFFEKKDIFVHNGKVSSFKNIGKEYEVVDMNGKVIIPTLFNIHSHLGESIFKDISGTEWTLEKYLSYTEKYNNLLDKITRQNKWTESAMFTINNMKKNGTFGFCSARSSEIANKYGIDTMSGYPIMNSLKLLDYKMAGLDGFKKYFSSNNNEKSSVGVFLHSVYDNDEDSFELAYMCMNAGAEFITIHISEDYSSMCKEIEKYNKTAVELLEDYGLLSEKTILVHCGYTSEKEFKLIKKRKAVIAICPISNKFLNTKMPNIEMLEALGIPWCIATDGLATGRTFSLFEQIQVAKKMFSNISYQKFFNSITVVPAQYYKRKQYTGKIEEGVEANFIEANYNGLEVEKFLENLIQGKIDWVVKQY